MKRCCFIACCCSCLLILAILAAAAGGVFYVAKQAMEPPANYVKSTVPLEPTKGQELADQIQKGSQSGQMALTLSKQDLRNIVASKLSLQIEESVDRHNRNRAKIDVIDVQVDFGQPSALPAGALPKAYPVPLDKSVRLDLIAAVSISNEGGEPYIFYPLIKVLAGVNDCQLYWAPVDFGIGPYNVLSLIQWAEKNQGGAKSDNTSTVEKYELPPGTCVTDLTREQDSVRLVFGPEAGAQPTEPATEATESTETESTEP